MAAFILGLFIGATIGFLIATVIIIAKEGSDV